MMNEHPASWTGKKSITLHAKNIEEKLSNINGDMLAFLELNNERYVVMLEEDLLDTYGDFIKS
jgi:hypothetical protein